MSIRQTLNVLVAAFDAVKMSRIGKLAGCIAVGFVLSVGLFAVLSVSEMMKASAVDGEVPSPDPCADFDEYSFQPPSESDIQHEFPLPITGGGEVIDWDENNGGDCCSGKAVWLDFDDYSGNNQRVYLCAENWDAFLKCVKAADAARDDAIAAADAARSTCLGSIDQAIQDCLRNCPTCARYCRTTLPDALESLCNTRYKFELDQANSAADKAIEACLDKHMIIDNE